MDDEFCGQGTFTHKNGDSYVGEFLKNKKSGQGCFYEYLSRMYVSVLLVGVHTYIHTYYFVVYN